MKTVVSKAATNATSGAVTTNATTATTLPAIKTEPLSIDTNLQFQTPLNIEGPGSNGSSSSSSGGTAITKRPASLDLNKTNTPAKKPRLQTSLAVLDTPDIVKTPDLEKILNLLPTPQPGALFPTNAVTVTNEQAEYAKGFEEALISLHSKQQTQSTNNNVINVNTNSATATVDITAPSNASATAVAPVSMSGGSFTYTNLDSAFPVAIKDEPQNPNSPTTIPIDMQEQEKIKLERKRQRNRVAASKCRKRKLERISKLEDKVKQLKCENSELSHHVKQLKDQVAKLKKDVIEHVDSGCKIPQICNSNSIIQGK